MSRLSKLFAVVCVIGLMALGVACSRQERRAAPNDWSNEGGRLRVLSSIGMIGGLVEEVGGDTIEHLTLIQGALDPHSYELVKGDDDKLALADVIFYNGLGLEHGASLSRYLAESDKAYAIGDAIIREEPAACVVINGQLDPHIWTDVFLWAKGVDVVVGILSSKNREFSEEYRLRGEALKRRLLDLHAEVAALVDRVPLDRRYLVTSHDAFNYFTRRYLATEEERGAKNWERRCTAPEGLSPEGQLSSRDIQGVVAHLAAYRIEVLFPESNVSRDSLRKIIESGRSLGLTVRVADAPLYADAMGAEGSGAETYEKMMRHNANVIAAHLMSEER